MHIPKGYIYFAMAFSVAVEMLNLRLRGKRQPMKLRKDHTADSTDENSRKRVTRIRAFPDSRSLPHNGGT